MPLLNINTTGFFKEKSYVFLVISPQTVLAQYVVQTNGILTVVHDVVQSVDDAVIKTLAQVLAELKPMLPKQKAKHQVICMVDDVYITTQRLTLNPHQQKRLYETLAIDIEDMADYEYTVSIAPKESSKVTPFLFFLIKKTFLGSIESVVNQQGWVLRRLMNRYHALTSLLRYDCVAMDLQTPELIVDISKTQAKAFVRYNGALKAYRQVALPLRQLAEKDAVNHPVNTFIASVLETYSSHNTQPITHVLWMSDTPHEVVLPERFAVQIAPLALVPGKWTTDTDSMALYRVGCMASTQYRDTFNMIPFMKRLEWLVFRALLGGILVIAVWTIGQYGLKYWQLRSDYRELTRDSASSSETAEKQQQLIEERNRISEQKKIMEFSDITGSALAGQLHLDSFLYNLISITTPDIRFTLMSLRGNQLTIQGTASALSGNYSFYLFLQKFESLKGVGGVRYSLGLSGAVDTSTFRIEAKVDQ
jgi:hypothetical protein